MSLVNLLLSILKDEKVRTSSHYHWLTAKGEVVHKISLGGFVSEVCRMAHSLQHRLKALIPSASELETVVKNNEYDDEHRPRVLCCYPFGLDFYAAFLATMLAGCIPVPVYPPNPHNLTSAVAHLHKIVESVAPIAVLTSSEYNKWRKVSAMLHPRVWKFANKKSTKSVAGFTVSNPIWLCVELNFKFAQDNSHLTPVQQENALTKAMQYLDNCPCALLDRALPSIVDRLAFLQFTSGSTAAPKGVKISFGNVLHNVSSIFQDIAAVHAITRTSSLASDGHAEENAQKPKPFPLSNLNFLSFLPPYHDFGLIGMHFVHLMSGSNGFFYSPLDFMMHPLGFMDMVSKYQIAVTGMPNFAMALCSRRFQEKIADLSSPTIADEQRRKFTNWNLSSIEYFVCGAEFIQREVLTQFLQDFTSFGFNTAAFVPGLGMAENVFAVSRHLNLQGTDNIQWSKSNPHLISLGSTVHSCPYGATVKIVDPDTGREVENSVVGEIWISSPSTAQGYWQLNEQTNSTFGWKLVCCARCQPDQKEERKAFPTATAAADSTTTTATEFQPAQTLDSQVSPPLAAIRSSAYESSSPPTARPIQTLRPASQSSNHCPHLDLTYMRSGDEGFIEEGCLYFCGRIKDIIILRGKKYHPVDIEFATQIAHPKIRPGCVAAFCAGFDSPVAPQDSEALIVVCEVRNKAKLPSEYGIICDAIESSIMRRVGISPWAIFLIPPRTIAKTTSGKIQRSESRRRVNKNEYIVWHKRLQSDTTAAFSKDTTDHAAIHSNTSVDMPTMIPQKETMSSVIIIGAGVSGLQCGISLLERGYKVTIVDKNDRAGGKIKTITVKGVAYDVGAIGIIRNRENNSVYTLTNKWRSMLELEFEPSDSTVPFHGKIVLADEQCGEQSNQDANEGGNSSSIPIIEDHGTDYTRRKFEIAGIPTDWSLIEVDTQERLSNFQKIYFPHCENSFVGLSLVDSDAKAARLDCSIHQPSPTLFPSLASGKSDNGNKCIPQNNAIRCPEEHQQNGSERPSELEVLPKSGPCLCYWQSGYGYPSDKSISALYLLKFMNVCGYLDKRALELEKNNTAGARMVGGFQQLPLHLEKVFVEMGGEILKGVTVNSINRNDTGVHVTGQMNGKSSEDNTSQFNLKAGKVVVTSIGAHTLQMLDNPSEAETKLVSAVQFVSYCSFLLEFSPSSFPKIPAGYYYHHNPTHSPVGHLIGFIRPSPDPIIVVWAYRDTKRSKSALEMVSGVVNDFHAIEGFENVALVKVHTAEDWEYMPHFSPENLQRGFLSDFESIQGCNNTFWCGSLFNGEFVETNLQYAKYLIEQKFPPLTDHDRYTNKNSAAETSGNFPGKTLAAVQRVLEKRKREEYPSDRPSRQHKEQTVGPEVNGSTIFMGDLDDIRRKLAEILIQHVPTLKSKICQGEVSLSEFPNVSLTHQGIDSNAIQAIYNAVQTEFHIDMDWMSLASATPMAIAELIGGKLGIGNRKSNSIRIPKKDASKIPPHGQRVQCASPNKVEIVMKRLVVETFCIAYICFLLAVCALPSYHFINDGISSLAAPWTVITISHRHATDAIYGLLTMFAIPIYLLTFTFAVIAHKWMVVGKYRTERVTVYSRRYYQWWFVDKLMTIWEVVPGSLVQKTIVLNWVYKLMGARVDWRAKFSAFVREFDLVTIDAFASIDGTINCRMFTTGGSSGAQQQGSGSGKSKESHEEIDMVHFARVNIDSIQLSTSLPELILAPVCVGAFSTINTSAIVQPGCAIGINCTVDYTSYASEFSIIPDGETLRGNPGYFVDASPAVDFDQHAKFIADLPFRMREKSSFHAKLQLIKLAFMLLLVELGDVLAIPAVLLWSEFSVPLNFRYYTLFFFIWRVLISGMAFCILTVALKWILVGRAPPGRYQVTLYTESVRWILGVLNEICLMLLIEWDAYPFWSYWLWANGASLGTMANVTGHRLAHIADSHLISLGRYSLVSAGSTVVCDVSDGYEIVDSGNSSNKQFSLKEYRRRGTVTVKDFGQISIGAVICPDSIVGAFAVLAAMAYAPAGSNIPDHTTRSAIGDFQANSESLHACIEAVEGKRRHHRGKNSRKQSSDAKHARNDTYAIDIGGNDFEQVYLETASQMDLQDFSKARVIPWWYLPWSYVLDGFVLGSALGTLIITYEFGLLYWVDISSYDIYILSWGLLILINCVVGNLLRALWKWILIGRFRPRSFKINEIAHLPFRSYCVHYKYWWKYIAPLISGSVWQNLLLLVLGAEASLTALIIETIVSNEDVVTIGDYAVIDRSIVYGHSMENFQVYVTHARIGNYCSIESRCQSISDCLNDCCTLTAGSRFFKTETKTQRETIYGGIPAQKWAYDQQLSVSTNLISQLEGSWI